MYFAFVHMIFACLKSYEMMKETEVQIVVKTEERGHICIPVAKLMLKQSQHNTVEALVLQLKEIKCQKAQNSNMSAPAISVRGDGQDAAGNKPSCDFLPWHLVSGSRRMRAIVLGTSSSFLRL